MSNLSHHPFDLDDRVVLTRPAWFEGARISATMEPTDFDDPVMVVESRGWTGKIHWMTVTAANGEQYDVTDMGAFRKATPDEAKAVLA